MKDAEAFGEQRGVGKPFKVAADEKPVPPADVTVDAPRVDQNLVPQSQLEANLQAPDVEGCAGG